jgi:hypothetical protein
MRIRGIQRKMVALLVLGVLAALAWGTMDAGKVRMLVFILLGGFALRILLTAEKRYDEEENLH